ncbi:MAG: hypothetical protein JO066_13060 [Verrucomicrobia bacterium]|nr:hypothetical protein [Verrucomicrobiota bacterium]MBV9299894.1 hypothetical protein [Verrucomicrobiota bacterium]MBV9642625.1 hypothetical protein [Verrucomicrobiota bacterium]
MPEHLYEIVFADSKWWFRSQSNETSFPTKIEAIAAALRSAHFGKGVRLRVHHETGQLEGELTITGAKPAAAPSGSEMKLRREVNRDTARSIQYYSKRPIQFVSKRIEELEHEIPLEAFVYRGGTALAILALLLSRLKNRAAWIFALCITALQLQYSYQDRSALTDLLRKRGYRSRKEIEVEKHSLQALRGDFGIFAELSDPLERARKCLDLFL